MADPHSSKPSEERRNFFRVKDRVILQYRPVPAGSPDTEGPEQYFAAEGSFHLMRELRSIDLENNKHLRTIGDQDRATESYLRGLNKKVDLLAHALAAFVDHKQESKPQTVSISEGGIAFLTPEPLAVGSLYALQITLLPDYLGVCAFGKVVESQALKKQAKTSLHFVNLKDSERQILARHIMQVQIAERRAQKDSPG